MSGGDIEVVNSVNSTLRAKGFIKSSRSIIGGKSFSAKGYRVFNLGNDSGANTQIQTGIDQDIIKQIGDITEQMKENTKELMLLGNSMKEMQIKYPPEVRNTLPVFKKVDNAIFTINKQQEELKKKREMLNLQGMYSREATVNIDGIAHEGVVCILGKGRWTAAGERRITLKSSGDVEVAMLYN